MIHVKDYEHASNIALKLLDLVEDLKIVNITPNQSEELYDLLVKILNHNAEFQGYLSHN
jgi:hypothetical protein